MKILNSVLCVFFLSFMAFAQDEKAKVEETVKKSTIEGHIYFLASDELRGREAGEPGADIAAKYLGTTLRRYGVKPVEGAKDGYYQKVPLRKISNPTNVKIKLNDIVYKNALGNTPLNGNIEADAVFINYGLADDYNNNVDYKDKVLIARAGENESSRTSSFLRMARQKLKIAKEKGALALIEVYNFDQTEWREEKSFNNESYITKLNSENQQSSIHHIFMNSETLPENIETAEIVITGAKNEIVNSYNVVGMVEGTDPQLKNEFVIYSAHYDHVGVGAPNAEGDSIYNGARDNAVGTVTVLSAAENIAKYPTKRSALFILFTAEEKGLLGSKYYVENPLIPLEQMVYCFNSDNASYNDTSKATIVGLNRTTAANHIKTAASSFGITAIDDPAPEQGLFDRSDNVHFAKKGIPAPTFSLGFTAFDAEVFKYYHQAADNPDNLDYDYLHKFFSAYVLSCRNIANAEETPFWVEGDKYYEAGKSLYNK